VKKLGFTRTTSLLVLTSVLLLLIPIGFYIGKFSGYSISSGTDDWARFGEYVGGTESVLISLFAFVVLALTLVNQQNQLRTLSKDADMSAFTAADCLAI
jgi:hypothetical protein